jgi:FkbM family methyltransferase
MSSKAYHINGLIKAVGVAKAAEILLRRVFGVPGSVAVNIGGNKLDVRPGDSDPFVLSQIFGWEEYQFDPAHLLNLRKIALDWQADGVNAVIIDAGANVGYSAIYLAGLFPGTRVLAIEPDRTTYEILERHAWANPDINPVHAALWSHDLGLELQTSKNGCWATKVAEGRGTPSRRLDALIGAIPNARPLIIKLDIEGAEREVVQSCPEIFAGAKCIMVEPHDFENPGAGCLSPLYAIAAKGKFDTILSGENLMLFATD